MPPVPFTPILALTDDTSETPAASDRRDSSPAIVAPIAGRDTSRERDRTPGSSFRPGFSPSLFTPVRRVRRDSGERVPYALVTQEDTGRLHAPGPSSASNVQLRVCVFHVYRRVRSSLPSFFSLYLPRSFFLSFFLSAFLSAPAPVHDKKLRPFTRKLPASFRSYGRRWPGRRLMNSSLHPIPDVRSTAEHRAVVTATRTKAQWPTAAPPVAGLRSFPRPRGESGGRVVRLTPGRTHATDTPRRG